MKRILFICLALAAVLGSAALLSNTNVKTAAVEQLAGTDLAELAQYDPNAALAAASSYYIYPSGTTEYEIDTITNATNDTVTIPVNLLSNREGCWWITCTAISGTIGVTATVQESSYLGTTSSAFDWATVSTAASISAAGVTQICFNRTQGFKQRLILDGTGTQSTRFRTKFVAKPI